MAAAVAKFHANNDKPFICETVTPPHVERILGGCKDHPPAVGVDDRREVPIACRRHDDMQRDVIAVDTLDDLGGACDRALGNRRSHHRVRGLSSLLERLCVRQTLFVRSARRDGIHARRQLPSNLQRSLNARIEPRIRLKRCV